MNKQIIETIKHLEIKKAPKQQSLASANESYTKDQLAHFIERHDLSIAKSWKKAEIVIALTDWMNETQIDYLQSDEDLLSFYCKDLMQSEQSIDSYDSNLSTSDLDRILLLIEHGLAFNVDGQLWVPDEAANAITESINSQGIKSKGSETKEKTKEINTQSEPIKEKSTETMSSFSSSKERLTQEKQQRLSYLKTQAKKKKRKKRK